MYCWHLPQFSPCSLPNSNSSWKDMTPEKSFRNIYLYTVERHHTPSFPLEKTCLPKSFIFSVPQKGEEEKSHHPFLFLPSFCHWEASVFERRKLLLQFWKKFLSRYILHPSPINQPQVFEQSPLLFLFSFFFGDFRHHISVLFPSSRKGG